MGSGGETAPGRLTRFGLALARPRWALAIGDDPAESGRPGVDLVVLLLVAVGVVHLREAVTAGWLIAEGEPRAGMRILVDHVAQAVMMPLGWMLLGAAIIWVFAGSRRAIGRDFDLACVAVVPMVVVTIVAWLVVRIFDLDLPAAAGWVVEGIGFAWTSVLILLAVLQARGRPGPSAAGAAARHLPREARRAGRAGGAGALSAAALALALEGGWVVGHLDWLRPMVQGDEAPAYALPKIEAEGRLGEVVESSALTDKVVVLDFWATWCGPCRDSLPHLSALARRGKGHIVVLSINLDDARAARAMFDEAGYATTLVADAGDTADRFGVDAIPHLVVVDRGGIVRMVSRGEGNLQQVIGLAEELGGLHGPAR